MAHEIICYRLTHIYLPRSPSPFVNNLYSYYQSNAYFSKNKQTKKNTLLYSTPYILTLMQYLDMDQILLSNSSNSYRKCPLKFFSLPFYSEIIQFNLKLFFLSLLFFHLSKQLLIPRLLNKKNKKTKKTLSEHPLSM